MPRGPAFSLRDSSPEFKDSVVFSTFVDRALSLRDSSSDIKKFRLRCSCCSNDLALINAWIQTDIERNVVELDLRVDTILDDYRRFELPQCMFTCKTLVALKVSSNCITYDPPASGCFLNVKKLYLRTEYPDNDSMGKIFCST
ncbi:F-box/FBD/LRR-repeat protein [Pyrus ussuriensis x Pyrus communis]|uniref:F-box/FBD/LRR-repeat protein n=1 Tax=Pyrus ussuriensis x Pyrus communis TaxID=2448454 RepID=A0A5N5HK16_9ROSA|nr:F-box/FBD/LRR-repeat protein [Pyrus ussuriensis x Pyrus communis]